MWGSRIFFPATDSAHALAVDGIKFHPGGSRFNRHQGVSFQPLLTPGTVRQDGVASMPRCDSPTLHTSLLSRIGTSASECDPFPLSETPWIDGPYLGYCHFGTGDDHRPPGRRSDQIHVWCMRARRRPDQHRHSDRTSRRRRSRDGVGQGLGWTPRPSHMAVGPPYQAGSPTLSGIGCLHGSKPSVAIALRFSRRSR